MPFRPRPIGVGPPLSSTSIASLSARRVTVLESNRNLPDDFSNAS